MIKKERGLSQLSRFGHVYLISQQADVISFFKEMEVFFRDLSVDISFPGNVESSSKLVVLDASFLVNASKGFYQLLEKKEFALICLVPGTISENIRTFVENKFQYLIPFPVQKSIFLHHLSELKSKIEQSRKEECKDLSSLFTETPSFFGCFGGSSKLIKKVRTKIERVALDETSVLLVGETGTGKTTCANIIHKLSKRGSVDIKPINISTIVDSLASSTLFGTKVGAYTDATAMDGVFKMADKSTLFIDEIDLASPLVQGMLLSVLETGLIQKVGSDKNEQVDFRLISATNANLEKLMEDNSFRKDLYYRISDNIIKLPALRNRKEDIPEIVNVMLLNKNKDIGQEAIVRLQEYDWPGNIRELLQCLNRAVGISRGDVISAEEIDFCLVNG